MLSIVGLKAQPTFCLLLTKPLIKYILTLGLRRKNSWFDYVCWVSPNLRANVLEIYVDRFERKNRAYDYISDLETREAILSKQGTEDLLAQSDNVIAKVLAKHQQFVQKLDESCKTADAVIDKAYNYVYNIFQKNGFNTNQVNYVNEMFENIYTIELGAKKVIPEYTALKKLPGFKDANLSHVNYIE